jgi:neutral ceramidase
MQRIVLMIVCSLKLLVAESRAELRVGFAVVDITPPSGYRMAGGYHEAIATGVNDPLFAKAFYFAHGDTHAAIVVCDVCGQERGLTDDARRRAMNATGIPVANISITATHTHGGPMHYDPILLDLFRGGGAEQFDQVYREQFVTACAKSISDAKAVARAATIQVGVGQVPALAFNRRFIMTSGPARTNPGKLNPDIVRAAGPNPDELPILVANDAKTGKPFGSFTTFDMHVTTYGGPTFSADFPAMLQHELRKDFGAEFINVHGEGCAGDTNQINVMVKEPNPTPAVAAQKLATAYRATVPQLRAVPVSSVRVLSGITKCPLRADRPDELTAMRAKLVGEMAKKAAFLDQVEAYRVLYVHHFRKQHGDAFPCEVQAFRLGDEVAIVTLPHEVFVELGQEIRKRSPFRQTFVVSIANEVDCYVPTRKAFDEGGYEVTNSPYQPGAGERLVEEAVRLLKEIRK